MKLPQQHGEGVREAFLTILVTPAVKPINRIQSKYDDPRKHAETTSGAGSGSRLFVPARDPDDFFPCRARLTR